MSSATTWQDLLDGAVSALWRAGAHAYGRLRPAPVVEWSSPGNQTVLVVAPHPDDEVVGCAGAILRHRAAGDHVTVFTVTDGRQSRAGGLGPDEMARRRAAEAAVAARLLDVELAWLGLPEGAWPPADLAEALAVQLAPPPDIVYLPSALDFHPEHRAVARTAAAVLPPDVVVRVYQVQVPLTATLTNLLCPIDAVAAPALAARLAHASQAASLKSPWRLRAYAAARHGRSGLAEPFWEMGGEAYRRLHESDGAPVIWQGVRARAWRDPVAFWSTAAVRRRVRASLDVNQAVHG